MQEIKQSSIIFNHLRRNKFHITLRYSLEHNFPKKFINFSLQRVSYSKIKLMGKGLPSYQKLFNHFLIFSEFSFKNLIFKKPIYKV